MLKLSDKNFEENTLPGFQFLYAADPVLRILNNLGEQVSERT